MDAVELIRVKSSQLVSAKNLSRTARSCLTTAISLLEGLCDVYAVDPKQVQELRELHSKLFDKLTHVLEKAEEKVRRMEVRADERVSG
ncbi:MAG: hypothetical protein DRJ18_00610 [Candidatus Methanomethylicota archaeon]|nr:MAG: hypothetical protein DRJ18_00610 [Candidatus Verstraetearchaeota archaeon]